ncbi:MAG: CheR family methyltransferase [Candidatus Methylomirabilales bacterium]
MKVEALLTDEEFKLFRDLIYEESGISLRDERRSFLEAKLSKRLRAVGMKSPYRYYKFLTEDEGGKRELLTFLDLLTINETSFFRNLPQFELLKTVVLPEMTSKKAGNGRRVLRLWSAGCSTGQEPYSMAMVTLEAVPFPLLWDIVILASDLSLTALEFAQQGVYPKEKVEGIDPSYLSKYFKKLGDSYAIREEVKRYVVFNYQNLKYENGLRDLDVIFCRNVMIYFDRAEQVKLIERLHRALAKGGYLFLGHAESLHGLTDKFQFIYRNKGTAYKKIS